MPITIGSNIAALQAQRRLGESSSGLARVYERLSSGMRINRASDDAAGLAIASTLNAETRIFNQAARNINDGLSVTAIAHGAIQELKRITERQIELATIAANGVYSDAQRDALNQESRQLTAAYNVTALTTEFNGKGIFTESWNALSIQAGAGSESVLSLNLGSRMATDYDPGEYFMLSSGSSIYAFYFTVNGVGSAPTGTGATNFVPIALSTEDQKMRDQYVFDIPSNIYDGATLYFGVSSSEYHYLWFDTDGDSNGDPVYGEPSHRVDISGTTNADEVADRVYAVLSGLGYLDVEKTGYATLETTALGYGAMLSGWDNDSNTLVTNLSVGRSAAASQADVAQAVYTSLVGTGRFSATITADNNVVATSTLAGRATAEDGNAEVGIESVVEGTGSLQINGGGSFYPTIKTADLNQDGYLDLVSATGSVTVRINRGDGTFNNPTNYNMGTGYIQDVNLADFNGDSILDMATANWLGSAMGIRLGNGDGTFKNVATFAVGSWATELNTADIDNDGDVDIGVAVGGSGTMRIMENDGNGVFTTKNSYAGVGNNSYISFSDINGDEYQDLIGLGAAGAPYVRLNNGNGTFGASTTYASTYGYAQLADVNGDGVADLVGNNGSNFYVRLNNGTGVLGAQATYAAGGAGAEFELHDMNGDGALDVVVAGSGGSAFVSLNSGNGTFSAATSVSMVAGLYSLAFGDMDRDGALDMVGMGTSTTLIKYGDGNGGYEPDVQESVLLVLGDARGRVTVNQLDLSSVAGARSALDTLAARMQRLADEDSMIGAFESRLEAAYSVAKTTALNYQSAASRILDADVAAGAADLLRLQLLQQAGAAVLGQANIQPALALRLLQSLKR